MEAIEVQLEQALFAPNPFLAHLIYDTPICYADEPIMPNLHYAMPDIPSQDVRIDTYHNAVPHQPFYVRVTHLPTGFYGEAQSKIESVARALAMAQLKAKLA